MLKNNANKSSKETLPLFAETKHTQNKHIYNHNNVEMKKKLNFNIHFSSIAKPNVNTRKGSSLNDICPWGHRRARVIKPSNTSDTCVTIVEKTKCKLNVPRKD